MIELLTANTPNGKKISIMLEEIKFSYKITKININGINCAIPCPLIEEQLYEKL